MIPTSSLARLASIGLTADQARVVAEIISEVEDATIAHAAGALEARRASDRERKARQRSRDNDGRHVTSRDVTRGSLKKEKPPTPPIRKNIPPLDPDKSGSVPQERFGADQGEIFDVDIVAKTATSCDDYSQPRAKPRTQLAEDAQPTDADRARATEAGMSRETFRHEWRQFRDHHRSRASVLADWRAAWRTWIGNWIKFGSKQIGAPNAPPPRPERRNPFLEIAEELRKQQHEGDDHSTIDRPAGPSFGGDGGPIIDLEPIR